MRVILILILALSSHCSFGLESISMNDVAELPVNFRIIKTCGGWWASNESGYYRVVVDVYDGAEIGRASCRERV